jgi:hypothetical protein
MTGFISLIKIYTIAGHIEARAHNIAFLRKYDNKANELGVREVVDSLDAELDGWSENLPDSVSASHDPRGSLVEVVDPIRCEYPG